MGHRTTAKRRIIFLLIIGCFVIWMYLNKGEPQKHSELDNKIGVGFNLDLENGAESDNGYDGPELDLAKEAEPEMDHYHGVGPKIDNTLILDLTAPSEAPKLSSNKDDRLDCWLKDELPTESACIELGCLWDRTVPEVPQCFFPKVGYGYKISGSQSTMSQGFSLPLTRLEHKSRFRKVVEKLQFQVEYITEGIVRFKFFDPSSARYEVPVQKNFDLLNNRQVFNISKAKYDIEYQNDDTYGFRFQIKRKSNKITVWDSAIGGLIFSDQFLQLASYLPSSNVYGIGENPHPSFKHDMGYKTWPLFAKDLKPSDGTINTYGVHPFYSCLEKDGKAHGVFFLNSNAMEFTLMPAPAMSVRTIGGVLDFFVLLGDNPENVVQLYTQLVGRPFMPPYWSLGFQLSRWGYKNINDIKAVVNRTKAANIPQDVQYADIDYMVQKKDFTWDKVNFMGMDTYMADTKENGLRWILILDPGILATDPNYQVFNEARDADLFIHWPDDIPLSQRSNPPGVDIQHGFIYGKVWPNGPVAFPDFFRNGTRDWWKKSIGSLYQDLKFDGLWIDMNEPSNFFTNVPFFLICPQNEYDDPEYTTKAGKKIEPKNLWSKATQLIGVRLSTKTLCMSSVQGDNNQFRHYNVHSLYGWSQMEPTIRAARDLTGQRSLIFSRSTYPSSGRYGGHWLGDNISRWVDLHRSIIGMMEFNLFGIPYIGADICGFLEKATQEMCLRWMQLGAFYPLSRNHNNNHNPDQDPAFMGPEIIEASRRSLNIRYKLLPYLYTLFYRAHVFGNTVVRPLFHEFPLDSSTYTIDKQFLWGSALLISPALEEKQNQVVAYLPKDVWYDYHTCLEIPQTGCEITITNLTDPPLHIRGGFILPTQDPALNTKESRQNPFSILAYPKNGTAVGEIFWDDGQSQDTIEKKEYIYLKLHLDPIKLKIENLSPSSNISEGFLIRDIILFGTELVTTQAKLNDLITVPVTLNHLQKSSTITVNIRVTKDLGPITIQW